MAAFSVSEPELKRAVAFIDGQNLFHCAREAFGYTHPNYDVLKLANAVCSTKGWALSEVHFYTGVPSNADDPKWNAFWSKKLLSMSRQGVQAFSRPLRYRQRTIPIRHGTSIVQEVGEEKGIDVRIAIDVIRFVHRTKCDVALVFSQDQDLSEVAKEVQQISREQNRWIKMASAFR